MKKQTYGSPMMQILSRLSRGKKRLLTGLLLTTAIAGANAQITVTTLGGGPIEINGSFNGFHDGSTIQESQFDAPSGLALDSLGFLYVADRNNGAIRLLDLENDRSYTHITGLNQPIAVTIDREDNLYVASFGDGTVKVFDSFGIQNDEMTGFSSPTAISLDSNNNIYVAESTGALKRINSGDGSVETLTTGLNEPRGIAVMDDGRIAISVRHAIKMLNPFSGELITLAGSTEAGFQNGPASAARFDSPEKIAKAGNNVLVVADRGNHAVRMVDANGTVTTIYGIDPDSWASDFPGWEDGSNVFAEAREPVGVTIAADGTIYTTEVYYHLIRQVNGANLTGSGGSGGGEPGEPVFVVPPTITPNSGYFPNGRDILVTSPNRAVYYTTDGSDPTTNSVPVEIVNNQGIIQWRESLLDLTSLRVAAYDGTNRSEVVSGAPASQNVIGVTRDVEAGIGSTAVIPIVLNLQNDVSLKSLQFRVEVTPNPGTDNMVSDQFRALSIDPERDFIPLVTSDEANKDKAVFSAFQYQPQNTSIRGLGLSYIGTNANFSVSRFAVAALVAVPIPFGAQENDSYRIQVLEPSGTSDGAQTPVLLSAMEPKNIFITNPRFVVGDSSPGGWYNAGEFGDGNLDNADVNNAFAASLGITLPYTFSDVYDSMDVFPEDSLGVAGGDGDIRFLDWQLILLRSLRLDENNWERYWGPGGFRIAEPFDLVSPVQQLSTFSSSKLSKASLDEGTVWYRQVTFRAGTVQNAGPYDEVQVPIYVKVMSGAKLSGLLFRATVEGVGTSSSLIQNLHFTPGSNIRWPGHEFNFPNNNEIGLGWDLGSLVASPEGESSNDEPLYLEGESLLGFLNFKIPGGVDAGDYYTIHFPVADGSPDIKTQYEFETICGSVSIQSEREPELISEEWKQNFFGDAAAEEAAPDVDFDGDGATNLAEYLAGTDPTNPSSVLKLAVESLAGGSGSELTVESQNGVRLRWLSAPGKSYVIESASDLTRPEWSVIAAGIPGDGEYQEYSDSDISQQTRFYRIRVEP